ncbi:tetratricopeptide repeat protein [Fontimonas thermophila]|uniref:tetratricopeptide repeat protein n=1 Tax=Fontimonas thermophila TaxID=1076937 RepID=UPI00135633F2|nr:tetratricopeptide repeat protein [Fontimonas thermophila]
MITSRFFVVFLAFALAACGTSHGTRRSWPQDEPGIVVAPAPPAPQIEPQPAAPETPASDLPQYPRTPEEISSAAVTALMRQARTALDGGRPQQAAAALERALRIEPRNYFVWSLLAQTYLAQNNPAQAANLAAKSNALARGNVYVELVNWRTIAAARQALGDAEGARSASLHADELERSLSFQSSP